MSRATAGRRAASAAVLALAAGLVACGPDGADPSAERWKRATDPGYGKEHLTLGRGGACRLVISEMPINFCRWSASPEQVVTLRYGLLLPVSRASGRIEGGRLVLDHGEGYFTTWFREGTQEDRNTIAYLRGRALIESGEQERGMAQWRLAADHGDAMAQNSLAWMLATDRNPAYHDGKQAVFYAEKAVGRERNPMYVDTLAAALARDGQLEKAARTQAEAVALLENFESLPPAERAAFIARFRARLALYRSGRAYSDP